MIRKLGLPSEASPLTVGTRAIDVFVTYDGRRAADIAVSRYAVRQLVANEVSRRIPLISNPLNISTRSMPRCSHAKSTPLTEAKVANGRQEICSSSKFVASSLTKIV